MSSSRRWAVALLSLLAVGGSGCGILGEKLGAVRKMSYGGSSVGCLDGFSESLKRYAEGSLGEDEWSASMDCVSSNIESFQKFVRPSDGAGYTVQDMQLFASKFLVSSGPVSEDLVRAGFELKAALLGGGGSHITAAELEVLLENLREIHSISVEILREIRVAARGPSDDDLLRFSDVARVAGERLAALLPEQADMAFSLQAIETFIVECRSFGLDLDPAMAGAIIAAKNLLIGGSQDSIEPDAWREMARLAGRLGGPLWIIFKSGTDSAGRSFYERRPVFSRLLVDLAGAVSQSMAQHGGRWRLALVDQVIDALPAGTVPYDRGVVKATLRPFVQRFMGSPDAESFQPQHFGALVQLADAWSRGASHINEIFRQMGRDSVAWQNLIDYGTEYAAGISNPIARQDAERLVALTRNYQPILPQGEREVSFSAFQEYSKSYLGLLHAMNLVTDRFLRAYGSEASAGKFVVGEAQFEGFFDDFLAMAGELKILDPSIIDLALKRFRDIDLFTLSSDGNGKIDERETTYFMAYAWSIAAGTDRTALATLPACPEMGPDPFGTVFVDIGCFENQYFSDVGRFWEKFPALASFYSGLDDNGKRAIQGQMAAGARRYGNSNQPIGAYDIQGYVGLAHYIESLMFRFDRNRNGSLSVEELLIAYPMFKRLLVEMGDLDPKNDSIVQAVFTYLVKYQKVPKKDAHFIWWYLRRPFWKINASRSAIFGLISRLTVPEPLPGTRGSLRAE
jgi:hypothetical protein